MVGGMCSMLPCNRMALVFAVMHLYFCVCVCYCFCPFLFLYVFKSGIDKSTEWSTIPACPSVMSFFNRGNTEGTNSSKVLCLMFVYVCFVLYRFVSELILQI